MAQTWSWVRRHPIVTVLIVLLVAVGISDAEAIAGSIVVILILLAVAWGVDRRTRRRARRDNAGRFAPVSTPKASRRGSTKAVPPGPTPRELNAQQRTLDQQAAALARREQQLQMERDEEIRRRAAALDAREAELKRRETGPFPTPQQVVHLSPQQMATQTQSEQSSPVGQSAFAETANRALPTAPARPPSAMINLNNLLSMTPTEFEEFCVRALQGIGYREVRRVGGAGDLTADIFAIDNEGRSTVVQCKRYKPGTKVGSPALQMFIGMKAVHHQADRGIYMTTADYSVPAVRLARQHDIVLIDGDDLVKIAGLVLMPKQVPQVAAAIARFCGSCGAEFTDDAKFCRTCGAPRVA